MGRPLRIEYAGAFYHVISRGNEGRDIYDSDADRNRFFHYLKKARKRFGIIIHAYCLMDNHYHLFVETPQPNLGQTVQMLNSSYTRYYHHAAKRRGHLFQGRYTAILVDTESYALELSRYIHRNPVKAKLVARAENYAWSSCRYYCGEVKAPDFITRNLILDRFHPGDRKAKMERYREFVMAGNNATDAELRKRVKAKVVLGCDGFVAEIYERFIKGRKPDRNVPALRLLNKELIPPEKIIAGLRRMGLSESERKRMTAYFLHKYTEEKLSVLAKRLGNALSPSAICKITARFEERKRTDAGFEERLAEIEEKLVNFEA